MFHLLIWQASFNEIWIFAVFMTKKFYFFTPKNLVLKGPPLSFLSCFFFWFLAFWRNLFLDIFLWLAGFKLEEGAPSDFPTQVSEWLFAPIEKKQKVVNWSNIRSETGCFFFNFVFRVKKSESYQLLYKSWGKLVDISGIWDIFRPWSQIHPRPPQCAFLSCTEELQNRPISKNHSKIGGLTETLLQCVFFRLGYFDLDWCVFR